ncbi:aminoacyl-tRNA hydrolase [Candidatus Babeliales bacterium]|nr:aminoacyl-tRNA hydrolase [Candidatus Babeliales bacterium]
MKQASRCKITVIMGLGNPGPSYYWTRHSIGFRIVDALAEHLGTSWERQGAMLLAHVTIQDCDVLLVKPQTFMNASGSVIPSLKQMGLKPGQLLVVHDELELPFGILKLKEGGSARGHNGLKSIMASYGEDFLRLRFGVGRPEDRDAVADYVLTKFNQPRPEVDQAIQKACDMIEELFAEPAP